jgi:hypothetical protein
MGTTDTTTKPNFDLLLSERKAFDEIEFNPLTFI